MKKKILYLSYNDFLGGAAIASFNMFKSISSKKYNLELNCIIKKTKDKKVKKISISFLTYLRIFFSICFSQFLFLIFNTKNKIKRSMCLIDTGLFKNINFNNVDIIHVHWLYNEVVSLSEILNIKKKLVISLHDLWFCNGTFHYDPGEINIISRYFEEYLLKRKCQKILDCTNVVFTVPSLWSKRRFVETLNKYNIKNKPLPKIFIIGNVVDFKKKANFSKYENTKLIPSNEFISLIHFEKRNNYVKAYDYLFKLLSKLNLNKKSKFKYFIIFGNNSHNFPYKKFNNLIFYDFGFVRNEKIDKLYRLSNIFILTSRQETFSQLTADSIVNKIPIVAFNCSGHRELISHKKNGYLAKKFRINDLIIGMNYFKNKNIQYINNLKKYSKKNYYKNYLYKVYDYNNFKY